MTTTPRKKLPRDIEERVLVESRRRCCICFGLDRDASIKQGQIAHLDGKRNNNDLDNLTFLCLPHHDQYDGRTSQSKGLTPSEIRSYRKELYEAIEISWKQPVSFGAIEYIPQSPFEGHYVREGEFESAEIDVRVLSPGRIQIRGLAFWGIHRPYGPNIGELDFEASLIGNKVIFEANLFGEERTYKAEFAFRPNKLTIKKEYVVGYFGMNVRFGGDYVKVT